MSKLALMFHGKFHCIKAKNVRKKNIVQTGPLTGEIKKNHSIKKKIIQFRATASSGIRKVFRVVIYIRKNWCKVKCVKSTRMGRNVSEV